MTITALLPLVLAASPLAAATGEQIAAPPLPGFHVAYQATDLKHPAAISEEVRDGETVAEWTRMVTTQRFGGLARRASLFAFANLMAQRLAAACPGAEILAPSGATVSGHAAVRMEVACPASAAQSSIPPETMLFLGVEAGGDILIKQVAFRGTFDQPDLAWGRTFLDSARLCGGAGLPACRR